MPSMEELKQKNQSIQMPSQIPMQTQMKAKFITISPDLWASIITCPPIRFTCNTALDKIVALSYLLQNKRYNQDKPRRTIRSFRSLSKQAQKEWLNKHRYSSSFNWDDELEM